MSKQRLGERFGGTRYVAVATAGGFTGVSSVWCHEEEAIWNALEGTGWFDGKPFESCILIRLKLTEREDVVEDGWCKVTAEDANELWLESLEDNDE